MTEHKSILLGNAYIRGFLQGAVRRGLDPAGLLQQAGISPKVYDDAQATIDGVQLNRLSLVTKEALNDIYMGFLEYPAKLPMEREVLEKALRCETLGQSIKATSQFLENYRNDFAYHYVLNQEDHEFCLGLNYQVVPGLDGHFIHLNRLINAYRYFCWLTGMRVKLLRICFPEAKPAYVLDYEAWLGCDVLYDQSECQLWFDESYLNARVGRAWPDLDKLEGWNNDWLAFPNEELSLASQVEQMLMNLQEESGFLPPVEAIACKLSMSTRTLRRQLARERESYQKIKTRVRSTRAIELLLTTEMPVAAVGEKVGYAEPGDFTRAFTRWTGCTPSIYRSAHGRSKSADC